MTRVGVLLLLVLGVVGAFEVLMQPTGGDRLTLLGLLTGYAALIALARIAAPRLLSRWRMSRTVPAIVVSSIIVAAGAIGISASLMFISAHDLRLVLVLLGLGAVSGIAFAVALTDPLARDLELLASAALRISRGDLAARSGVVRGDEVGEAAAAFDAMAARLEEATAAKGRMEGARRRLFTEIGHDLRTPLAALRAATEALEDGIAEDPGRYLKVMRHDLDTVGDLVDDLFLIARMDSGSFDFQVEAVDLAELAEETIEGLRILGERDGIRLRVTTPGHAIVHGGPAQLARVIRNLVENAIQHAPRGTEVIVEVSPGERVTAVRVTDQGDGFAAHQRAHAFDRFVTWDAESGNGERTGLGLAIARGLVDAHGGRIWIEPGPGGRVAFEVPVGGIRRVGQTP